MADPVSACNDITTNNTSTNSGWPWMKHAKSRLLEDPMEPVDQWDDRPSVHDLVEKHSADLVRVKKELLTLDDYDETKHDDLWMLRFLLSHPGSGGKKAVEAMKSTLAFRRQYHLDDLDLRHFNAGNASVLLQQLSEMTNNLTQEHECMIQAAAKMLSCYQDAETSTMIYYLPDARRGMLGILQVAQRNQHEMVSRLTQDDYYQAHLFITEWKFQWMDYLTRTTGRLTKYLSIADCHGVKRSMIDKESKKRDAHAAQALQHYYPQLLGSMLVLHAPAWINVVFAILKPFLSKRLLDKVNLVKPHKRERDLHQLLHYCAIQHLPIQYGGKLPEQKWPPSPPSLDTL